MLGYYGKSVILTYIGVAFAVFGMANALNQNTVVALICLMFAGFCDMFDGTVARRMDRTEQEKSYGVQIDALADLVSFGIFPAVIGYSLGLNRVGHMFILFLYVLAALIRLAYFNVTELERQEPRTYYEGLPVTTVALIVPILYLCSGWLNFPLTTVYGAVLVLLAVAFVSKFRIPKPNPRQMLIFCVIGAPFAALLVRTILVG